jgi:diadenosine tetraphosphate (Ap4A) HIT family hydrolase
MQRAATAAQHNVTTGITTAQPAQLALAGIDCYLCPPRLSAHSGLTLVAHLSASSLYLDKDQRFRGQSSLILTDHATRLDALSAAAYIAFMEDLRLSTAAIRDATLPDHMNVALLGNSCPHLHWSIVPRYRTDPRWGRPIWEDSILQKMRDSPVKLTGAEYSDLIQRIREHL